VLVIAIFYTSDISGLALGVALAVLAVSLVASRMGVRKPLAYAVIGLVMWLFLLKSGVHATVGGVLLAFTIPSRMRIKGGAFLRTVRDSLKVFEEAGGHEEDIMTNPRRQSVVHGLEQACEHVQTPLNRLEHMLHPWVAFVIMPVFALANAGVPLGTGVSSAAGSSVGLGVALGLVIGKPVGIVLSTWAAVKLGIGQLPEGTSYRQIVGAGFLAGIGFTMSLFIANLAFKDGGMLQLAKYGILGGSLVSGIVGFLMLRAAGKPVAVPDES
jgi:NhaA family Na+:H+ antiporter